MTSEFLFNSGLSQSPNRRRYSIDDRNALTSPRVYSSPLINVDQRITVTVLVPAGSTGSLSVTSTLVCLFTP